MSMAGGPFIGSRQLSWDLPCAEGWPGPLAFAGLTAVCRSVPVVGIRATSGFNWIPAQASLLLSCGPGPPCGLRRAGAFLVQVGVDLGPAAPGARSAAASAGWQAGSWVASWRPRPPAVGLSGTPLSHGIAVPCGEQETPADGSCSGEALNEHGWFVWGGHLGPQSGGRSGAATSGSLGT